jgi:phosphotriesterase-related protein
LWLNGIREIVRILDNGFGKGPGLTYILWRFVPWMLEAGISRAAVEGMLIANPASLFA